MSIRIDGYSERGMVNAVCEDIIRSEDVNQLTKFLSWCSFPFQQQGRPDFSGITSARIIVEQSFSDFGDLDLLILLDHADRKQAVLIEAKVATETRRTVHDQWENFLSFLQGDSRHTSSLFVQLYRKMQLIKRVADMNQSFEPHPIWGRQSLGANRVVLKAAQLLAEYRSNPWYIALVPDDNGRVAEFFSTSLKSYIPQSDQLPGWDVSRIGYLTWPSVHEHIQKEPDQWKRSLAAFKWNDHQVYQPLRADCGNIAAGSVALWKGQRVVIVYPGQRSHRAIPAFDKPYFPMSFLVDAEELTLLDEDRIEIGVYQPKNGETYNWNPPAKEQFQPPDRAIVPVPPQLVKVTEAGWKTTRVVLVNTEGIEQGDVFHVFPHHLQRLTM